MQRNSFFCKTTFWRETEREVRSWGLGTSCVHFLTTFSDMFSVIFIFPPLLPIYHYSPSKFPITEANFLRHVLVIFTFPPLLPIYYRSPSLFPFTGSHRNDPKLHRPADRSRPLRGQPNKSENPKIGP